MVPRYRFHMPSSPSDNELLQAARRSPERFAEIFDRYFAAIHSFAAHRIGRDGADDIAAETFVRAFAARDRVYTVDGSLRAWLYSIANNLVRDVYRRQLKGQAADIALQGEAIVAAGVTAAATESPDPDLVAALAQLRDEEQEVLALFAWGDLSYEEIAAATDVAVGTVRSRLSRARAQLRSALETVRPEGVA